MTTKKDIKQQAKEMGIKLCKKDGNGLYKSKTKKELLEEVTGKGGETSTARGKSDKPREYVDTSPNVSFDEIIKYWGGLNSQSKNKNLTNEKPKQKRSRQNNVNLEVTDSYPDENQTTGKGFRNEEAMRQSNEQAQRNPYEHRVLSGNVGKPRKTKIEI